MMPSLAREVYLRKSDTLEHFYATQLPALRIILGVECGGFQELAGSARWAKSPARLNIEALRISPQLRIDGIIVKISRCHQGPVMSLAPNRTVAQKNRAMRNLVADEQFGRKPNRSADVSILTSDHAKPRLAHLHPDCHSSFDGDIKFQTIYGKRLTIGSRDFVPLSATLCQLLAAEGRLASVLRPSDVLPNSASLPNPVFSTETSEKASGDPLEDQSAGKSPVPRK